jgi:hypothetical protein
MVEYGEVESKKEMVTREVIRSEVTVVLVPV